MPDIASRASRMPAAERRKQILATARQMILRGGIGAINMSILADTLGVGKPIIYKHFHNTEDLVVAILHEYMDGTVRVVAKKIRDLDNVYQFFDVVVDELFEYVKDYGPIVPRVTSGFSASPKIDQLVRSMRARSSGVYRYLLVQQGATDIQASLAADALSLMISNTIYEYAEAEHADHRATLKAMVHGAVRSLVKGEGVKPHLPDDILVALDAERKS